MDIGTPATESMIERGKEKGTGAGHDRPARVASA